MKLIITLYSPEEAENLEPDDLVMAVASQKLLAERIASDGYNVPKALVDSIKICQRELDHKLAASREKQLETLLQRRAALATVQEKRESLDREIEELQNKSKLPQTAQAVSG